MSHLERRKRYPSAARSNREEGTVYVRFRIDDSGNVLSVSLSRSSGYPTLDSAVLDMVRAASPVPAPPAGVNKTITAPVRFNLR
jgi:protein TonB